MPSGRYCRVTVTDYFGGRGHDYKCKDPTAEQKGGMLVIATSIPDEREWIQWKGRTARQDYRGQYKVILSEKDDIFTRDNGKDYLARFRKISDPHAQIESLLNEAYLTHATAKPRMAPPRPLADSPLQNMPPAREAHANRRN